MKDFYLDTTNTLNRLIYEYRKHKKLVVAYDYDNTVYDCHDAGHSYDMVIDLIRRCKKVGFDLVVFTYSEEDRFPDIEQYLNENEIPFDRINANPDFSNKNSKKIFYNILLDDRAGLQSAYDNLNSLVSMIELETNFASRGINGMSIDIWNELNKK